MNIKAKLYTRWLKSNEDLLQGDNFYPIPDIVRRVFEVFKVSPSRQILVISQMLEGVDLSSLAPNELGCMEAVSRIWNTLFQYKIFTYTPDGVRYMEIRQGFVEIDEPEDGCVMVAETGTGNGKVKHGHIGYCDGLMIWNNNSPTGTWKKSWTIANFIKHYQTFGGMKVRFFKVI